jgi:hypothetical protein
LSLNPGCCFDGGDVDLSHLVIASNARLESPIRQCLVDLSFNYPCHFSALWQGCHCLTGAQL